MSGTAHQPDRQDGDPHDHRHPRGHTDAHSDNHLHEIEELIANVPLFSGLGRDDITQLARRVRPRNYGKNEQLYGAGEPTANLFVIHTGRVKIYRLAESGHEQVIRVLGPGEFLGEASFLSGEPMDHFAVTVEPGEICSLHARDLGNHVLASPSVAMTMLSTLSRRLESTEQLVSSLTSESAGRRVAGYLLGLSREAGSRRVTLPVAKKDVASQLGLTPETLSRKLAQFEDAALVALSGSTIDILDASGLEFTEL